LISNKEYSNSDPRDTVKIKLINRVEKIIKDGIHPESAYDKTLFFIAVALIGDQRKLLMENDIEKISLNAKEQFMIILLKAKMRENSGVNCYRR
jgi:hypothetical protein